LTIGITVLGAIATGNTVADTTNAIELAVG